MTDGKIKVSVVLVASDNKDELCECVSSIVHQTLKEIELILVDDGSTDDTKEMCEAYAKIYPFVKSLRQEIQDGGSAKTLGLSAACGEYVAFCDAFGSFKSETFEYLYDKAKQSDAEILRFGTETEKTGKRRYSENKEGLFDKEQIRENFLFPTFGLLPYENVNHCLSDSVCGSLFRREFLEKNHSVFCSDKNCFCADKLFNIEVFAKAERVYAVEEKFYFGIEKENPRLKEKYRAENFQAMKSYCEELFVIGKKLGIYDDVRLRIKRTFLEYVQKIIRNELLFNDDKKTAQENIKAIMEDQTTKDILTSFPVKQMPFKQRMVFSAMKKGNASVVRIIKI